MAKIRNLSLNAVIALCLFFLVQGCAFNKPSGAHFEQSRSDFEGQSIVYIYRRKGEPAYDRVAYLNVNQESVTKILSGGFTSLRLQPTSTNFNAGAPRTARNVLGTGAALAATGLDQVSEAELLIDLIPEKTYFLRYTIKSGMWKSSSKLILMDEKEALEDLRAMRQIETKD